MTEATLDASYPTAIQAAHAVGQQRLHDPRTRDWLYRRLPAAFVRSRRMVVFPAPWADAEELLAEQQARIGRPFQPDRRFWPEEVDLCERRVAASRRAIVVGHTRGEGVVYWHQIDMPDALGAVLDWLNALDEEDPRLLVKLPRVTWEQAVAKARIWHERLAKLRSTGIAGDDGTTGRIDVPGVGLDGWYWCQLVTKGALDREGAAMGHCVGSRSYDHYAWKPGVQGPPFGVWSLRDESGRSRVTAEVVPVGVGSYGVTQAFGPKNARPADETAPAFASLARWFAPPRRKFALPIWLVRDEDGSTRLRTLQSAMHEILDCLRRTLDVPYDQLYLNGDVFLDQDLFRQYREENDRPPERSARASRATGYNSNARRGGQHQYAGEPAYRRIERRFGGRPS